MSAIERSWRRYLLRYFLIGRTMRDSRGECISAARNYIILPCPAPESDSNSVSLILQSSQFIMEKVRKTFFNPLVTSKAQIREILEGLPVGSAHPFSPERILLCRTDNGVEAIDISSYPEDFFFNALDLGEMGEVLLRRMAQFPLLSMSSFLLENHKRAHSNNRY